MFNLDQFLNCVQHEVNVIKHLYTKVPKDKLDYRPTPKQRSLSEVIQHLPTNLAIAKQVISGDWSDTGPTMQAVREAALKDFNGTMDREFALFAERVRAIPAADFTNKKVKMPMGEMPLGDALLAFPFKFLPAYKMQFFLYLKACGREELNTINCWGGMDGEMPKPPQQR
ncbi:MAG: hypothetical protein KIS92_12380 [Planctomycetota bacterium]|nr:hypothetical protein [Planctomycetota bacterium]